MLYNLLLADLANELPSAVRLQTLVRVLKEHFQCGAVCLLKKQEETLVPMAVEGLVRETLGRRFLIHQHPRLAIILASRTTVTFEPDSSLPDPYDGLLKHKIGEPLQVHDCMGISLYLDGKVWGVLTLDALEPGTFDQDAQDQLQSLALTVAATIRTTQLEQDIRSLRMSQNTSSNSTELNFNEEILGQSSKLKKLLNELEIVADSELPILLTGETGVGKDLFARRIHQRSRRAKHPLVQVNCAALPESLAESELFGHVKGAYSGATQARAGRFEAASGGTLFLDEVGELPLTIQAKLLRALQNGEIQRLGEDETRKVDVRIIAATNRDLPESIRSGEFRADLYHRLSVYPVPIPPLRERDNDVLLLAGHFLELNRGRLNVRSLRLASASEDALMNYSWPGNVRELEHVISRACLKAITAGADRNDIITLGPELLDLDDNMIKPFKTQENNIIYQDNPSGTQKEQNNLSLKEVADLAQKKAIEYALIQHKNNWAAAARFLKTDSSNLHKLAKRLDIK